FNATAPAYTLNGNGLTLGVQPITTTISVGANPVFSTTGTTSSDIGNSSANDQTINFPIALTVGKHSFTTATNALNLHGAITQPVGSFVSFNAPGPGVINATGSNLQNVNGILGGWAVFG